MDRDPVRGECVVVTRNAGEHPAHIGLRMIVCRVDDSDDTIKGIPAGTTAVTDYWIPWSDVEPVEFGWDYARERLPAEVVALLGACDGIDTIALNPHVKAAILESLPDWRGRVLEAIHSLDGEAT